MDQNLLVFILSVIVFVLGAGFINYTVKKEDAATQAKQEKAAPVATSEPSSKVA